MTPRQIQIKLRTRETIETESFITKIFEVELSAGEWQKFLVISVGANRRDEKPETLNIFECGDEPRLLEKKLFS